MDGPSVDPPLQRKRHLFKEPPHSTLVTGALQVEMEKLINMERKEKPKKQQKSIVPFLEISAHQGQGKAKQIYP